MSRPVVAIVGRPNVGKSLLFNRLAERKNAAIVEDTPGVTRDRIYAKAEWRGRTFDIIDTGGIEPKTDNEILRFMREQAYIAISHADVVVLVTDVKTGVTAADADVAAMLQRAKKPIVLCVNKLDTPGDPPADFYEFYNLGLGDPVGISAMHGYGTGDLLDRCYEHFPAEEEDEGEEEEMIKVALIGKPNAGKSSLINRICGNKKAKVENRPGVTLDKQWVSTSIGVDLLDMPGILWPKFEDAAVGEHLALTGAIKDDILDTESLAVILCDRLRKSYPDLLATRYKLGDALNDESLSAVDLFMLIGKKRGFLISGGEINTERTSAVLLEEFRAAKIGRITLDSLPAPKED